MPFTPTDLQSTLRAQVVETARSRIGKSTYAWKSEDGNPPDIVNCATFVQWVIQQHGLPEHSYSRRLLKQLYKSGKKAAASESGDLVFVKYPHSTGIRVQDNLQVSHVGILTAGATVIHASQIRQTVVEEPVLDFTRDQTAWRGVISLTSICPTMKMIRELEDGQLSPVAISYMMFHRTRCLSCDKMIPENVGDC